MSNQTHKHQSQSVHVDQMVCDRCMDRPGHEVIPQHLYGGLYLCDQCDDATSECTSGENDNRAAAGVAALNR